MLQNTLGTVTNDSTLLNVVVNSNSTIPFLSEYVLGTPNEYSQEFNSKTEKK